MTKEQYESAKKALKRDCKITGQYIDGYGNTCAIGALALKAGVTQRELIAAGYASILGSECTGPIASKIQNVFGLSRYDQSIIQVENDGHVDCLDRRVAVLQKLEWIYTLKKVPDFNSL